MPFRSITIYLIKDRYDTVDSIIDGEKSPDKHELPGVGDLYVKKGWRNPPKWAQFFEDYVPIDELGYVESTAAVFLIESRERLFAVTFGQGRYLLNPGCWEERFGLRVGLNSIGDSNIRSIDKVTFDAISRHSKEQASREVPAREFGLDIEQDLLRAVTGRPNDGELGTRLYGMDALHVSVQVNIGSIKDLLARYYNKYLDNSYKKLFPWVDHIGEIKDLSTTEQLDNLLITQIIDGELDRIWMAVPEVIEWDRIEGFCFSGFGRRCPLFYDIHIPKFLKLLQDIKQVSKELLTSRKVYALDNDGRTIYKWQVYHCLHAEIEYNDDSYLLSGGKWYRIDKNFVKYVEEAYSHIPTYQHPFLDYDDASETAYNERIAQSNALRYALMDRKLIPYGGIYQQIEFCDLFVDKRDIVHIKRYAQSSALSHLFSQGLVSGELFFTDEEFRRLVNERLPEKHRLEDYRHRPQPDELRIVFAVISDAPGDRLIIPFFSKLNCKHAARRLAGYGYGVLIGKINVNENRAKLMKYR